MAALTKEQFIAHWLAPDEDGRSFLSHVEESIAEHAAQYGSECALFGDAGPGQGYRLQEMKAKHAKIVAQLKRLGAL